jgi:hypothetical protein
MRGSPLAAIAVTALLVTAGCTGLPETGETQPSADAFPEASAVDESVFDAHSEALANTSFTLTVERIENESAPAPEQDFRYSEERSRFLVEPGAAQYLVHTTATGDGSLVVNGTTYSDGTTAYRLSREDGERDVSTLETVPPVFDESRGQYLWQYWFGSDTASFEHAAVNATFEREGVETVRGVPVMRYEAAGVDALSETRLWGDGASEQFEAFSATLLLDEDGVVRQFEYEFVFAVTESGPRRVAATYSLSDVGTTDVEEPEWMANATAES